VTLLDGEATVLGGSFALGQENIVPNQKQLPIETPNRATLEITLERSGRRIFEIQGSTIPASWRLAADALEQLQEGRVIIIGPPDVGKSTLCVFLVNRLLQKGQKVRIIDADVGQAVLGPPTTIARATPTRPITSLQDMSPDRILFIGDISPNTVQQAIIRGIQRLTTNDHGLLTIINTDGWVADLNATMYKIELMKRLNPKLVLGLSYANELDSIMRGVRLQSMKVNVSREILERTRIDRKRIRAEGYRRFLEGAVDHRVDLRRIRFPFLRSRVHETPWSSSVRNLIVGLLDCESYLVNIGILTGVYGQTATIYSRETKAFERIEVGRVKLSGSGREIGFL